MKRALCFMARIYLGPTAGVMAFFAVASLVGSQALEIELFSSWYVMLPMFAIIFAMIYGWTLTLLYRIQALSMNCRRQDFFWASQVTFLLFALISLAVIALAGTLPRLLHFGYAVQPVVEDPRLMEMTPLYADPRTWPVLFLFYVLIQPMGAATGELYYRHKVLATVLMIVFMLVSVASVVLMMFLTDGSVSIAPAIIAVGCGVMALIGIVCDIAFYWCNKTAVVR